MPHLKCRGFLDWPYAHAKKLALVAYLDNRSHTCVTRDNVLRSFALRLSITSTLDLKHCFEPMLTICDPICNAEYLEYLNSSSESDEHNIPFLKG